MDISTGSASAQPNDELQTIYDRSAEGILIADIESRRVVRANPAICRMLHYTEKELLSLSVDDLHPPEGVSQVFDFFDAPSRRRIEPARNLPCLRRDGSILYADTAGAHIAYHGRPCVVGFFHDVTEQKRAMEALRESEGKLRSLFENLPDLVVMLDEHGNVLFINRDQPQYRGRSLLGECGFGLIAPEHRASFQRALDRAISSGLPQSVDAQDILGLWWSFRLAPVVAENGESGPRRAMAICTNVTQERRATEAIKKEQQLLRRLLDLHERERQLIAYEIHDGFAQQLTGALFRLQGFRETLANNPAEAWKSFDSASQLLCRSIDETRRLISGLRPPILDELGVFEAVQYLIYERRKDGGPEIEFDHDVTGERFPPPLENAIFRIVQESLNNACRHSRSDRIRVSLAHRNDRIYIDVRDWGIGFEPSAVEENRFGLQGIRERVRLLEGRVTIESAPGGGTHIAVELPLAEAENAQAVIFDMDGVLVDTYRAHYQSWLELAEAEGLHLTEAEFAATFGRTTREIIARLWGNDRYSDAEVAELDRRKEAAFRRIIEADFPAMPGASELIRSLHDAGLRLAVGSSGPPENVALVLDRLGARDLFAATVTADDVTRGKPDPDVFLIAAKRLGVAPANCAVIEDAPAGVAAANAAGMASIGLLSTGRVPEDLTAAHLVVRSLGELSPHILRDAIARRPSPATLSE